MSIRRILGVAAASAVLMVNVACDEGPAVMIEDFKFSPRSASQSLDINDFTGPPFDSVHWHNGGGTIHNVTNKDFPSPVFSSGDIPAGSDYTFRVQQAGRYLYRCTIHPRRMKGWIDVRVSVFPTAGPEVHVGDTVNVDWSATDIPAGFEMDVQIKRKPKHGSGKYHSFMANQTGSQTGTVWVPDRRGTYSFRARLQLAGTKKATSFSHRTRVEVQAAP